MELKKKTSRHQHFKKAFTAFGYVNFYQSCRSYFIFPNIRNLQTFINRETASLSDSGGRLRGINEIQYNDAVKEGFVLKMQLRVFEMLVPKYSKKKFYKIE